MFESPINMKGDIFAPDVVREAAERSMQITVSSPPEEDMELPFGEGKVFLQEVQPGLRCEFHSVTCSQDREFEITTDPMLTCNLTLEGSIDNPEFPNLPPVQRKLNQATLMGFHEPTYWIRRIRNREYFKTFGFTLTPAFFERFANLMDDGQLSVFEPFITGTCTKILPKSQKLIDLGNAAFTHPYNGILDSIYHESNTLQFVLEVANLLQQEGRLVTELGRKHYDRLMHARDILDKAIIDPPKSLELAREVGSNVKTLQAHFKHAFGTTIFGYISAQRLEMAKVLISEHGLGSAEAGYKVGFSSPAAFAAAYRRYFGSTPTANKK